MPTAGIFIFKAYYGSSSYKSIPLVDSLSKYLFSPPDVKKTEKRRLSEETEKSERRKGKSTPAASKGNITILALNNITFLQVLFSFTSMLFDQGVLPLIPLSMGIFCLTCCFFIIVGFYINRKCLCQSILSIWFRGEVSRLI